MKETITNHRDEQGSILLYILATILLISGIVYHYYTPYRLTREDYELASLEDKGITGMFAVEKITSVLLSRIDINLFRQFRKIAKGEPIIINIPYDGIIANIQLKSQNNCINITRAQPLNQNENIQLRALLVSLSGLALHERSAGIKVFYLLDEYSKCKSNADECENYSTERRREEQVALTRLSPWLCRRETPGQRIDINSINRVNLPVLQALLAPYSRPEILERVITDMGNNNWDNIDSFVSSLNLTGALPAYIKDSLATESEDFILEINIPISRHKVFYSHSNIQLLQGKALLLSRRLIKDNSI